MLAPQREIARSLTDNRPQLPASAGSVGLVCVIRLSRTGPAGFYHRESEHRRTTAAKRAAERRWKTSAVGLCGTSTSSIHSTLDRTGVALPFHRHGGSVSSFVGRLVPHNVVRAGRWHNPLYVAGKKRSQAPEIDKNTAAHQEKSNCTNSPLGR